ncbi:MAG TPA: hypothetical protein VMZ27_12410 [Candidatus Saccharimonadales bacterium]|nr:hypothetical protein [Candidatus Saccharimonadales bacterium]
MSAQLRARLSLGFILLLTLAQEIRAEERTETLIPSIAEVAGVKIGFSTQGEVEARWGKGKVIIGGHPTSGRLWQVKGTEWVLQTDGFEYAKRGLVVDSLVIRRVQAGDDRLPKARLKAEELKWMGEMLPGIDRIRVTEILKKKGLPLMESEAGIDTHAVGFHSLENQVSFKNWTAKAEFKNGNLKRLALDAH